MFEWQTRPTQDQVFLNFVAPGAELIDVTTFRELPQRIFGSLNVFVRSGAPVEAARESRAAPDTPLVHSEILMSVLNRVRNLQEIRICIFFSAANSLTIPRFTLDAI